MTVYSKSAFLVFTTAILLLMLACEAQPTNTSPPPTNTRSVPTATPSGPRATETLAEYWNRTACFDLFDRVQVQLAQGMSSSEISSAMVRASIRQPGALNRYGVVEVLEHCMDKYWRSYQRSR